jgi:hypothetical protein
MIKKFLFLIMFLLLHSYLLAGTFISPNGYKVVIPNRIYGDRPLFLPDRIAGKEESINIILNTLDSRVQEWIESHPELDRNYLENVARSVTFKVRNAGHFKCEASNAPYKMCVGLWDSHNRTIGAALYRRLSSTEFPFDLLIPYWTIGTGRDIYNVTGIKKWLTARERYFYGYGDILLAVIPYELDHVIEYGLPPPDWTQN